MADKIITTRIQNKSDTSANWALATTFIPLEGEVIFYSDLNKVKIGDGLTLVNDLPFIEVEHANYSDESEYAVRAKRDLDGNDIREHYQTKITDTNKLSASLVDGLSTVATSGSYSDLSNKPTIPTKVSDLTNDSGYTTNKGTVTSVAVQMNGSVKGTVTSSGTINLGTVATTDTTYTLGTNGNSVTLKPSSGNTQSITVPYATQAVLDGNGRNINNTYLKKSNDTTSGWLQIGATTPTKGDGSTPYFASSISMLKTASAIDGLFVGSAKMDYFAGLFANSDYIGTCSYKGDGSDTASSLSDGNWIVTRYNDTSKGYSGSLAYLFDATYHTGVTVPISSLATKPFVLTVKKTSNSRITATDTLQLQINGWDYSGYSSNNNYYGFLNAYKLEILTDYANDTWVEVFNRSGASDPIGSIIIPLWSTLPGDSDHCKYIYGIRLTITEATPYSTNTFFGITSVKLLDTRPAGDSCPADAVYGLSGIGTTYLKGEIQLKASGRDYASRIIPAVTNTCYIGTYSQQFIGIYGATIYENGTALVNKYVAKNSNITAKTGAVKINYDAKGLVTGSSSLLESDIPSLSASKITSGTFADARIASAATWNAKYTKPSTGIPASDLADSYLKLSGGTVTGDVTFSGNNTYFNNIYSTTSSWGSASASSLDVSTGTITANKFIKTNGTSSQFLKADGSVDSNTYCSTSDLGTQVTYSYDTSTGTLSITPKS